jgi:hypothetical protein
MILVSKGDRASQSAEVFIKTNFLVYKNLQAIKIKGERMRKMMCRKYTNKRKLPHSYKNKNYWNPKL